jgi:phosphopantetheinyl transferase
MKLVARVQECEVWLVDLRASESQYESALVLLSDAERARACAIRGEQAHRRFVLARAALRVRLGHELGIAPERVALRSGEHGKPEIAPAPREERLPLWEHGKPELVAPPTAGGPPFREHGTPEIASPSPRATISAARVSQGLPRFNLAHRDDVALLAINYRRDAVGVDLERIAPESERPWRKLLERICHPSEAREALDEARMIGARAFYERWAGKEAVLKALGHGLRVSPAEVPLRRDTGGVLRVAELPARQGPTSGLPAIVEDSCAAAGVDRDLAGYGWAGCRLATVRTPAGLVGAVAILRTPVPAS